MTLPHAAPEPARPQSHSIVIEGAALFDGTGRSLVSPSVVVLEGETIAAAGKPDSVPVPRGARIIRAEGKTLIPGLIDCHIHYERPRDLIQLLAWGVTSANCMVETAGRALDMEKSTREPAALSPRLYTSAPMFTAPAGWWAAEGGPAADGENRFPSTPGEARRQVRRAAAAGRKRVKVMYDDMKWCRDPLPPLVRMDDAVMSGIVEEAAAAGIATVIHAPCFREAAGVVLGPMRSAGRTPEVAFAHGILDKELGSLEAGSGELEGFLGAMHALTYTPTFCVFDFLADLRGFMGGVLGEARFREVLPVESIGEYSAGAYAARYSERYPNILNVRGHISTLESNLRFFAGHGSRVVMGTDMWALPGIAAHLELERMVQSGMTAADALLSATSRAAAFLGQARLGVIESGARADLLILDANPLDDIRNTRSVRTIIKHGVVFDHTSLIGESKR